jgi:thiol-disulfide isomerase/thioredoxin
MPDFFGTNELAPANFSTSVVKCGDITKLGTSKKYNGGIVLFYASWCPHCVNYKDTYKQIIDLVHKNIPGVFCRSYNAETKETFWRNKKDSFVQGYPTLIKYKSDGAGGYRADESFMGDRDDLGQIMEFIRELVSRAPTKAVATRAPVASRARAAAKTRTRAKSRAAKSRAKSRARAKSRSRK